MIKRILIAFTTVAAMVASAAPAARPRTGLSAPAPAPASTTVPSAASAAPASGERHSIMFNQTPIDLVFKVYGDLVGKTILKDPSAPQPAITLTPKEGQELTDEDKIVAIEAVLEMNGIHLEPYGEKFVRALARNKARKEGIPLIMDPDAELGESAKVVSVLLKLKNIGVDEAKSALDGFKSDAGNILAFERTSSILVTDTEQNVRRMREIVTEIDKASQILDKFESIQIKHASASDIKTILEAIVQDSQKELEKNGKNANANIAQKPQMPARSMGQGSTLLDKHQPSPASAAGESLVVQSDADRGMIRGKVLIIADERSNKLLIVTQPENLKFFKEVISQLDVETTPDTVVQVFRLKFADAEEVSDMINDLIGNASNRKSNSKGNQNPAAKSGTGSNTAKSTATTPKKSSNQRSGDAKAGELSKDNTTVLADKRINGLVVMTDKELLPTVKSIIESMDVKLSQVLIETAIIEVTLGDTLNTGIDWVQNNWTGKDPTVRMGGGGGSNAGVLSGLSSGKSYSDWITEAKNALGDSITSDQIDAYISKAQSYSSTAGSPIGSGVMALLKSDKLNLSAVVSASKSDARSKYIASPIIMTVDNKEATINATDMTYLLKGFTSSGNSYSTIAVPDYEQKELGIEIKVTPKINPNGTVMLNVETKYTQKGAEQTIKYSTGNTASGSSGGLQDVSVPTTATREMNADVLLENMQTVILGGLTDTYKSESETGIPILKDIPWIGKWLFGSVSQSETRKELLIFMTPYVLNDGASAQAEAIRRKNVLSDSRPWDDRGWSASELADPVAKKELMRRLKDEWKRQDEDRKARLAIENEKVKRAQELETMSKEERDFWLEMHKDELEKEQRKDFEAKLLDPASQGAFRALAAEIRAEKVKEADAAIKAAEESEKQEDVREE